MIDLFDIRYVRLGTRNLEAAIRFTEDIVGLDLARIENAPDMHAAYFKSDDRDHTLCWFEGDPADQAVGFELNSPGDLEMVAGQLAEAGFDTYWGTQRECELRRVRNFIRFKDPSGAQIEIVSRPFHSGVPYHGSRKTGITGFNHIGLHAKDPIAVEEFWTRICNARVSDWVGDLALLRLSTYHHSIALFPSKQTGIQHINHQVESIDDIMRAYYFLKQKNVPISFGPGRHPTSSATFLYFQGPEGMTFEYSCGVRHIAPDEESSYRPRQFPVDRWSVCFWGAQSAGALMASGKSDFANLEHTAAAGQK